MNTRAVLQRMPWVPSIDDLKPGDVVYIRSTFDVVHKRTVKETKYYEVYNNGTFWVEMEEHCGCLSTELVHKDRLQEYFDLTKANVLRAYEKQRAAAVARIDKEVERVKSIIALEIRETDSLTT